MKTFFTFCFCTLVTLTYSQRELWGTVSNGGNYNHGYIFKTDSIGNNMVIVHHFQEAVNGRDPGALLAASNNKLYGLTAAGGQYAQGLFSGGVFYEYDLSTSVFKVLQEFGAGNTQITGVRPAGDGLRTLTEVYPGIIYGQIRGPYQTGVLFSWNAATQNISTVLTIPTFQGGSGNTTLGNRLEGTLYFAPDGYLYGTTYGNSQCPIPNPNFGSIVKIDPVATTFSISYLCPCTGNNGFQFDNHYATYNNKLYSVARFGGANGNKGVIYSFDPATSAYTNKYSFLGGLTGMQPSTMVEAANGKFYGTADGGTPEQYYPSGCGILYEFDPATDQFTKKLDFTYGNGSYLNVGPFPFSLINGNNGKLYGVTPNGVFEYHPSLNVKTARARFPVNMGWYSPATPAITSVCRKPTFSPAKDTTFKTCLGSSLAFAIHSDNALNYVWTQNGTPVTSQTTATLALTNLTAANAGTWVCTMTNACGSATGSKVNVLVNTHAAVVTQQGSSLQANTADTYQWINCDNANTAISGETSQVFTPASNGNYAVVTNSSSCQDTSGCYAYVLSGLTNSTQQITGISLFPNPVTNELNLSVKAGVFIKVITVMSTTGQVILQGKSKTVDVTALKPGTYLVLVETTTGTFKGRFVKTDR
ncbi:hypothetical protein CNR22_00645 [Sphingobacteriaceae bacterium]|nr:hypothetical protein CNR22_00645 [Sphingobacteriaceae bacterium]